MWSGAEDMQTISTLFQVPVKITMVSRKDGGQISWNNINFLPDPRLREFRLLAHAILTPLHIINYNQVHFSLVTKRDSPLATLGDVTTQLERETKEEEGKLKEENDDSNNESDEDTSPGSPGYINGLPAELDLQEKLDYKNEQYKVLKQLYAERIKDGINLDYKNKYEEKNKELIKLKSDYVEALSCLRKETKSREKFEAQYKTVQAIIDAEEIERDEKSKQSSEEENDEQDNSDYIDESEDNNSDEEDNFESYGNTHGKYVRAPNKRAKEYSEIVKTKDHGSVTTEDDEENWEVVKKKKTKKSNENKEKEVFKFVTQGEYKCDQCNKSFVRMYQLRKHNMNWHEELNWFICQKLVPSKKEIMTHKERDHKMVIRECKYFSEGTCQDGAEECIYSHGNNKRDQNGQEKHQNKPGKENREQCKTINCRDQR